MTDTKTNRWTNWQTGIFYNFLQTQDPLSSSCISSEQTFIVSIGLSYIHRHWQKILGHHCTGQVLMNLHWVLDKGRHHKEKHVFFRALPEKGGVYPCPNFLALFHQVKVPIKLVHYYSKLMIYVYVFCHHYHQNYHHYYHNYHYNHYYNQWYFFCHTCKTLFWRPEKNDQVARIGGRGGFANSGNAWKKTCFYL